MLSVAPVIWTPSLFLQSLCDCAGPQRETPGGAHPLPIALTLIFGIISDMASTESPKQDALAPPVLNALRNQEVGQRATISRTSSTDIRAEREDLKAAAEQSLNVMLDLALDGTIRGVSPSWKDVVGTSPDEVKGKPIADLLLSNQDSFASAIESMKNDDSKSHIIRFRLAMGPDSVFRKAAEDPTAPETGEEDKVDGEDEEETRFVNLKGQGIMVYERSGGGEGHVRSFPPPFIPVANPNHTDHVDAPSVEPPERGDHRLARDPCRVPRRRCRNAGPILDFSR